MPMRRRLVAVSPDGEESESYCSIGVPRPDGEGNHQCEVEAPGLVRATTLYGIDGIQALVLGMNFLHSMLQNRVDRGWRLLEPESREVTEPDGIFDPVFFKKSEPEEQRPDARLTKEQRAIADGLEAEVVASIDGVLLSTCGDHWLKVAMVVLVALDKYGGELLELPPEYFSERVRNLVSNGKLEARGDLTSMRFSEVRLAKHLGSTNGA